MDKNVLGISTPTQPEINADEFVKVVESRRSVRRFTDEPVPDEIVDKCLDLAMLAPNSCNLHPWEFYWIKDKDVRAKIVTACLSQNAAKTSQQLIAVVARTDTWRKHCAQQIEEWPATNIPKLVEKFSRKVAPLQYYHWPFDIVGTMRKAFFSVAGLTRPVPRGPGVAHPRVSVVVVVTVGRPAPLITPLPCDRIREIRVGKAGDADEITSDITVAATLIGANALNGAGIDFSNIEKANVNSGVLTGTSGIDVLQRTGVG